MLTKKKSSKIIHFTKDKIIITLLFDAWLWIPMVENAKLERDSHFSLQLP